MWRRALCALLLVLCVPSCRSASSGAPRESRSTEGHAAPPARTLERLDYVERTCGGAKLSERLPLLVVLHGLGDTPEDFLHVFDDVSTPARLIAARAPDAWGSGSSWYAIEADASEKSRQILARANAVAELIEQVAKTRPTLGKAVVSGFSQGGVLSFALASYHAQKLLAALPIAGSLPTGMPAPGKAPAWFSLLAFHGQSDRRIPFREGEQTFERLKRAGYQGSLIAFPGVGHGIPPAMQAQITSALNEQLDLAGRAKSP